MNRYRQFKRAALFNERRLYVEIVSAKQDGTSVVETPEGRRLRVENAPGLGIPAGSKGFVRTRETGRPLLERTADDLPLTSFTNL